MAKVKRLTSSLGSLSAGLQVKVNAHIEKDPKARREISDRINAQMRQKVVPTAQGYVTGLIKGLAETYGKGFPDQLASGNRIIHMTLPEVHRDGSVQPKPHNIKVHSPGLRRKPTGEGRHPPYWKWKRRTFQSGGVTDGGHPILGEGNRLRLLTGQSAQGVASLAGGDNVTFKGRATQGKVIKRGSVRYLTLDRKLGFKVKEDAQWNHLLIQSLLSGSPVTVDVSHRELPRGKPLTRALHQEIDRPMAGPAAALTGRIMMRQLKRLRFETNLNRRVAHV